jgi:hypothetical protein
MKICLIPILIAAVLSTAGAQPVDLRLNLAVGETYRQTSKSTVIINQLLDGQPFDMTMKVDGTVAFRIESKEDNNYAIRVQYEHLSLGMDMDGQESLYTSEKIDTTDLVSLLLGEMKDNPFHMVLSDKGRVLSVTGIDGWIEPALGKMSRFPVDVVMQVIEQVKKSYGEDAVKGNIELATAIFPGQPVSKGETWTTSTQLNSTMKADIETQYTLIKLTHKIATLDGQSTIVTDPDAPPMESPGATIQYHLKGGMQSVIELDVATGWISSSTFKQQLEGENLITPTMAGLSPMKVPMKLMSDMTIIGSDK